MKHNFPPFYFHVIFYIKIVSCLLSLWTRVQPCNYLDTVATGPSLGKEALAGCTAGREPKQSLKLFDTCKGLLLPVGSVTINVIHILRGEK